MLRRRKSTKTPAGIPSGRSITWAVRSAFSGLQLSDSNIFIFYATSKINSADLDAHLDAIHEHIRAIFDHQCSIFRLGRIALKTATEKFLKKPLDARRVFP